MRCAGLRLLTRFVLAAWALTLTAGAADSPASWWDTQWPVRRAVDVKMTGAAGKGAETGVVSFWGLGRLGKDAGDVRVAADGQMTPCKVLASGPDDRCVVAFKMPRDARRFYVYWGNPKPAKALAPWEPDRGLWLETRRFNGGNCENWEQMKDTLAKSGPAFGADAVRSIYHGWNLFSDSDRYVSIYHGFLNCMAAGEYTFCTSSSAASFVFLDDKPLVAAPGWHQAVGHARHTNKAQLQPGVHKLDYYHVCGGGTGTTAAYWQPPGESKLAPIPPEAFTLVSRAQAGTIESVDGKKLLDVEVWLAGTAYVGDRPLYKYHFRVSSPSEAREIAWDFGDGQTGSGRDAEHIYLRGGLFKIAVSAKVILAAAEAALRVRIQGDSRLILEDRLDAPKPFLEDVRRYKWETLDISSLQAASACFVVQEDVPGQTATARALLARGADLPEPEYFEQAIRLQSILREKQNDGDGALKVLLAAQERLQDKNLRAKTLREIGDVYYYFKHDLDRALLEYDKVVGRYAGLEDHIVRVTKIRIGDIMRERGEYEKAAANYADAERFRLDKFGPDQTAVRSGALVRTVEDFLRRGEAAEARRWLEVWEWEFPMECLRGQSSVLRARVALLDKNVFEARKQLQTLVRVNPDSQYIGEALLLLSGLSLDEKDSQKARELLKEIIEKHPDSESVPEAEERLKKLEHPSLAPRGNAPRGGRQTP